MKLFIKKELPVTLSLIFAVLFQTSIAGAMDSDSTSSSSRESETIRGIEIYAIVGVVVIAGTIWGIRTLKSIGKDQAQKKAEQAEIELNNALAKIQHFKSDEAMQTLEKFTPNRITDYKNNCNKAKRPSASKFDSIAIFTSDCKPLKEYDSDMSNLFQIVNSLHCTNSLDRLCYMRNLTTADSIVNECKQVRTKIGKNSLIDRALVQIEQRAQDYAGT